MNDILRHRRVNNPSKATQVYSHVKEVARVDKQLFLLVIALVVFGIVMVYNTSVVTAFREFGDKFRFARLQAQWAGLGLLGMLITARVPYQWWAKSAKILLYISIGLLILVLLPGVSQEIYGARRWLHFGGLTIQPSELAKFSVILYLATTLGSPKSIDFKRLLATIGAILGLIILQPDLGTTLVLGGTALAIYWASGAPLQHFVTLLGAGIVGTIGLILASPYRAARLWTFFDHSQDPLGSSYHVRQVLIALGSGGWTGLGLGQSRQKYAYLPEVSTDSIFAVIGEEIGFLGAVVLVIAFVFLFYKGIQIAKHAPDTFGRLLATGIICWLSLQVLINLAAMVVLVPLTGIPLPFISYGGSALVVALSSIGIVLNISRYGKSH